MSSENRRPIAARQNRLSQRFAHWLAVKKILTPNQISLLSVLFAAFGALFMPERLSGRFDCSGGMRTVAAAV